MTTMRIRTRGLAAASAATLLLSLAACGGDTESGASVGSSEFDRF